MTTFSAVPIRGRIPRRARFVRWLLAEAGYARRQEPRAVLDDDHKQGSLRGRNVWDGTKKSCR